jgi:mono/diheme cytochrome c family protein
MKTSILFLTAALTLLVAGHSFAQDGEKLFKANCAACHTIGKGKLVGPDLLGVETRHPEVWMLKWIKSSQTLVKSGDVEAVRLFKENNGMPMTDQSLKDDEIKTVLAYIKDKGAVPPKAEVVATAETVIAPSIPGKESPVQATSLLNRFSVSEYILLSLVFLMAIMIWILSSSIKSIAASTK